jgi:hypothetical protein
VISARLPDAHARLAIGEASGSGGTIEGWTTTR